MVYLQKIAEGTDIDETYFRSLNDCNGILIDLLPDSCRQPKITRCFYNTDDLLVIRTCYMNFCQSFTQVCNISGEGSLLNDGISFTEPDQCTIKGKFFNLLILKF